MSPSPSTRAGTGRPTGRDRPAGDSTPAPAPRRRPRAAALGVALALALALALTGCAQFAWDSRDLSRQVRQIGCISRCQETKDRCDADARYDYAQCQAGYRSAYRDYRWCLAANDRECGYPWWSCSENRYGYCTNRFWECDAACRRPAG